MTNVRSIKQPDGGGEHFCAYPCHMEWTPDEIRNRRLARGYRSQRALAHALGVSLKAVTNWETGVGEPSAANIRKLDEILGSTPNTDVSLSEATDSQLLAEISNRFARSAPRDRHELPPALQQDGRWMTEDAPTTQHLHKSGDAGHTDERMA